MAWLILSQRNVAGGISWRRWRNISMAKRAGICVKMSVAAGVISLSGVSSMAA